MAGRIYISIFLEIDEKNEAVRKVTGSLIFSCTTSMVIDGSPKNGGRQIPRSFDFSD
jgi:hypothetical protein